MKKRLPGETWSSAEDKKWSLYDHPVLASLIGMALVLAVVYGLAKVVQLASAA